MGWTIGAVEFPLNPFDKVVRETVDPALQILGDLILAGIQSDLNATYQKVISDGYVIKQFIPTNPESYLTLQEYLQFPCVAVWRERYVINNRTLAKKQRISTWKIQYILGETGINKEISLIGFLNAVSGLIETIIHNNCTHPNYNDGYSNLDKLGFSDIKIINSQIGAWTLSLDDATAIRIPVVTIEMETYEFLGYVPDETITKPLEYIYTDIEDGYQPLINILNKFE
ncbi:MAG: hypothetical protein WC942_08900 [Clostridia bacterium]|jgi:hypothetical protein